MNTIFDFHKQLPILYSEIRTIAERELRTQERPEHTWRPSDLTHEALISLLKLEPLPESLKNERVFSAYVTRVMRNLLTNYGIQKRTQRRGGKCTRVAFETLDELGFSYDEFDCDKFQKLDPLIQKLKKSNPLWAEIAELRLYSGESVSSIADLIGMSQRSVQVKLKGAIAWLAKEADKLG